MHATKLSQLHPLVAAQTHIQMCVHVASLRQWKITIHLYENSPVWLGGLIIKLELDYTSQKLYFEISTLVSLYSTKIAANRHSVARCILAYLSLNCAHCYLM